MGVSVLAGQYYPRGHITEIAVLVCEQ